MRHADVDLSYTGVKIVFSLSFSQHPRVWTPLKNCLRGNRVTGNKGRIKVSNPDSKFHPSMVVFRPIVGDKPLF